MKRTLITLFQILLINCCFGQSVDTAAVRILHQSFNKLAAIENLSYSVIKNDTMVRAGRQTMVTKTEVQGNIKKNTYQHFRFDDGAEWLIRKDTVYKKKSGLAAITYSNGYTKHEILAYTPEVILGANPQVLTNNNSSLKFSATAGDFYVIDIVTKMNYNSTEVIGKRYFTRIWINKTSLLPARRLMYSKRLDSGKEAIDIYDFLLTINNPDNDGYHPSQFFIAQISKQTEPETLKPGNFAPKFTATDVRTGKPISLAAFKNKVIVLDFWYLSCMPCRELMPKIEQLHKAFKGKQVAFIGINFVDTNPKQINQYLKNKQITYQHYYKAQQARLHYKIYAAPTTMVIGKDGKIKWVDVGLGADTEAHLAQAIKTELAVNIKPNNY